MAQKGGGKGVGLDKHGKLKPRLNQMLTAIITGLIVVLGLLSIFWWAKRALTRSLAAYVESPDEKTPSQLDMDMARLAAHTGQQLAFHLKQTLLGEMSGQAKQQKGVERAVAVAEAAGGNAAIEGLLNSQSVKSFTRGKPWLIELAANFLSNRVGAGADKTPSPWNGRGRQTNKFGGF